ncbi:MAG: type II toxin-antitoxin system HicB family antitoxin [Hyphomicrobiales bacterium]
MTHYVALIDGREGAYGIAFPDCPGCTAMAATLDEMTGEGTKALREWMIDRLADGQPPPGARPLGELVADREFKEALADGAVAVAIPLLIESGRVVRANLSLDAGLLDTIDEAARRRGLTRSSFMASAAKQKILAEG